MKKKFDTIKSQEDEVIRKYLVGEPMSLEEISLALWMIDGRPKNKKPLTKMGINKMLERICLKLRNTCEAKGISKEVVQDLASRGRTCATNKFDRPEHD